MRSSKSVLAMLACMAAFPDRVESQERVADIVYALDHSNSMSLEHIWIAPDESDTVYLYGTIGCPGYTMSDLNNHGRVTLLSERGTREVRRINPNKPPTGCVDLSGDPFSQRAIVLRGAIDFQAARAPASRAGYLAFSRELLRGVAPRPLDSPANLEAIAGHIEILPGTTTNYLVALDQAKRWLTDPLLAPRPVKALVFISDGLPNHPDDSSHLEVLSSTFAPAPGPMPPIYGIFLSIPRPDSVRLHELTRMTGGRFFLVPPHRPDSLRTVMERVIDIILDLDPSTRAGITRESISPSPAARFSGFSRQPGRFMYSGSVFTDLLGRIQSTEKPALTK